MRFIDQFKESPEAREQIEEQCPFPEKCHPMKYAIGSNGAGPCAGLIADADDLDCIQLCIFTEDNGKLRVCEQNMTPTEALSTAGALTTTAESALWANKEYKKHYEYLCSVRGNRAVHMGNGKMLEARIRFPSGKIVSRQYIDINPKQAQKRAQRIGKVISVRKVDLWNIMGDVNTLPLKDIQIVGDNGKGQEQVGDLLTDGTLDGIVFSSKKKTRKQTRRWEA